MKNKVLLTILAVPIAGSLLGTTAFASTTPVQQKVIVESHSSASSATKNPTSSVRKATDKEVNDVAADKAYAQSVTKAKADYKSAVTQAKTTLASSLSSAKNKQEKMAAQKTYKDSVKTAFLAKKIALKEAKTVLKKASG
jgi:hypothetical protein